MKLFWSVLALALPCLGACDLPLAVASKRADLSRAEQDACLKSNVAQFDDRTSDARQIGRFVAMSCSVQTGKVVQNGVPYATRREYDAFQNEAAARASVYVQQARGTSY